LVFSWQFALVMSLDDHRCRLESIVRGNCQSGTAGHFGTETEGEGGSASRDPLTQMYVEMPAEGPLTDAGLEIWPTGIHDLAMQVSRE